MHLSAPLGSSVNKGIDPEHYSLAYSTLDDAIKLIAKVGRSALMAKADLKSAFRMIPVQKKDWDLLGIYWRKKFYVDKRLPFGLHSSSFLFNQLLRHYSATYLAPQASVPTIHLYLAAVRWYNSLQGFLDITTSPQLKLTLLGIQH